MNESLRALAHARRVLVLHDLRPEADNAAWRAGLLAQRQGSWLRLLHVSRWRNPTAAHARLSPLAWRLQEHLHVPVLARSFRGSCAAELRRAAQDADLIVLRAFSGLDAATGLHPLQAAQAANRPTLVVRTPATVAYRRIAIGVEGEADVHAALPSTRSPSLARVQQ